MAYAKDMNGAVAIANTQLDDSWVEVASLPEDKTYRDAWILEGNVVSIDPAKAAEIAANEATVAVQQVLDNQAQSMGYDSIFTAVTYAEESTVPSFQQDGVALRAWRSLVWSTCYTILDDVMNGNRPQPTVEELLAELPSYA